MYRIIFLLFILQTTNLLATDINLENITIVRDKFGVPHIYANTDEEAAYGLAWVQAEDNFYDMQETMLALRGLLGSVSGKDGVVLDAIAYFSDVKNIVAEKYETTFSPEFKKLIEAYTAAINKYAATHPSELRSKKLFPITPQEIIEGYSFSMMIISNVPYDLQRIFKDDLESLMTNKPSGSNGFAVSPTRTDNGKTFLISNSHQPVKGFAAWYEVQVNSNEGWNFHGATFAYGITPFIGTNHNLGWTHCLNYHDFHTVYELKMHPNKKNYYEFDGEWLPLEVKKVKLKVKMAGIKIPVSKKFYKSKHGMVIKNKSGYYAIRYPASMVIGAAEQWYRMNKSETYDDFMDAFSMQQFPCMNTIYADKAGNIMFLDNGLFPEKNSNLDWNGLIPGNSQDLLWNSEFFPVDSLINVTNPNCGYVFNSNNTGFNCTCPAENPIPEDYNSTMGYLTHNTSRSIRFQALMDKEKGNKISKEKLLKMKFDKAFEFPLYNRNLENFDDIRHLDANKYPHIKESIEVIKRWDGNTNVENKQATIVSLAIYHIVKYLIDNNVADMNNSVDTSILVNGISKAQKHLKKHFGEIEIPLGHLQKHTKGNVELPIGGMPEVLAAMYITPYEKGKFESFVGETFIMFATYNKDGVEKIETINCFGTSNHADSPHYTDQMEMFLNNEFRVVTFDKAQNIKNAEKVYSPE